MFRSRRQKCLLPPPPRGTWQPATVRFFTFTDYPPKSAPRWAATGTSDNEGAKWRSILPITKKRRVRPFRRFGETASRRDRSKSKPERPIRANATANPEERRVGKRWGG